MDFTKLLLLGGGAYILYQTGLLGSLFSALTGSGTPTGTPSNPSAPPPANPATPPPAVDIRSLMISAMAPYVAPGGGFAKDNTGTAASPLLPSYDWNYIYKGARGRDPGAVVFPPGNIALDEWLPPAQAAGFSGLTSRPWGRTPRRFTQAAPQNNIQPEPVNPCTPVPGMGRMFSGGF